MIHLRGDSLIMGAGGGLKNLQGDHKILLPIFREIITFGITEISRPSYRDDCKILYPFDRGDHKINKTNFA